MKKKFMSKSKLAGLTLIVALAGSAVVANAGPHYKGHYSDKPIERMLKRLDLSDEQEAQVEVILEQTEDMRQHRKGFPKMKAMMMLDPDSEDYTEQVNAQAVKASEQVKTHMLKMAEVRKDIHSVLTEEQKLELKELMAKRMSKMEKRCDDD
jgi:Spy/CpxP family protein refolding chaperone